MKTNPTEHEVEDLEIFQVTEGCMPGYYFYAHDAEPFASSPEGHGTARYIVGPFATKAEAEEW